MKLISSLTFAALAFSVATAQQQQPTRQTPSLQQSQSAQPAQPPQQNPTPPPGNEQPVAQTADTQQTQAQQQGNFIALRVVGSWVRDPRGLSLGRIEEVLLNRNNGAIEFAIVAPNSPTAANTRLVPMPWSMLNYAWDQAQAGGPAGANQVFVANVGAERLAQAPSLDRSRSTTANDPVLAAASMFFSAQGGAGNASSSVSGSGAASTTLTSDQAFAPALIASGVGLVDTNGLAVATNGGGTNASLPPSSRSQTNFIPIPRPGSAPPYTPLTPNPPAAPGAATGSPSQPASGAANSGGIAPPSGGQRASGTPVPGTGKPPGPPVTGGGTENGTRVPATGGTGSGSSSGGAGTGGSTGGAGGSTGGAAGTR